MYVGGRAAERPGIDAATVFGTQASVEKDLDEDRRFALGGGAELAW